jgi:long-chain fatty acid transport protein
MSKFDKYNDLFAEGGDFDIPAQLTIGLAVDMSSTSVLTADVQHIWFSDVDSVGNSIKNLTSCPAYGGADQQSCFGGANGPGFGWDDMTILKVGYQWQSGSDMTYRVGASYGKQPISESTLNILAPAVIETHLTFGLTKKLGKDNEFSLAAMYAPENKVKAASAIGQADNVEIKMHQFEVEASYAWKF